MAGESSAPPVGFISVGFIGAGRTAGALAPALSRVGYAVVSVTSRSRSSAKRLAGRIPGCRSAPNGQAVADAAGLVFITTPDATVAEMASGVRWRTGQRVVHCSGALTLEPLAPAAALGAETGSLHPVMTFGPPDAAPAEAVRGLPIRGLQGAAFGIEAGGELYLVLAEIARRLGGIPIRVPPGARPLYHAAAVMGCGYLVALMDTACDLWRRAGLPPEAAAPALGHLARATLEHSLELGWGPALTGPMVREDTATVQGHLEALASQALEALPIYAALGARCAELASSSGRMPPEALEAWRELFHQYEPGVSSRRAASGPRGASSGRKT